jgi:hypothetical protein
MHDAALAALDTPIQLDRSGWTNRMLFVPAIRITCIACGAPRPNVEGAQCPWPWCDFVIPDTFIPEPPTDEDLDEDGMYDEWERLNGLNPDDPADAELDSDGDTFTNLEEFKATPQTDPFDKTSRPSFFPDYVIVVKTESYAFQIVFNSKVKNIKGVYSFGLNYRSGGQTLTKFVKLGDTFAGFKVDSFEEKMVPVEEPFPHKEDQSELTLVKGKLRVVLTFNKRSTDVDRTAVLAIKRGTRIKEFPVAREGDVLTIDGNKCRVTKIDTEQGNVVLTRERDRKVFTIKER